MESRDRIATGLRKRTRVGTLLKTTSTPLTYLLHSSFSLQSGFLHFHMMEIGSASNSQSTCFNLAIQREINLT